MTGWGGEPSPFMVDGHLPEIRSEVRDGFVVRYRLQGVAGDRCVDAVWIDDEPLEILVNQCEAYERPA